RNLKASDLARYLAQIYTNGAGSGGDNGGQVGPGLSSGTLGSADNVNANPLGSTAGSFGNTGTGAVGGGAMNGAGSGGFNSGGESRDGSGNSRGNAETSQQYASSDGSVRISSVDSNNQLLIRARPSQWEEIKRAIDKL